MAAFRAFATWAVALPRKQLGRALQKGKDAQIEWKINGQSMEHVESWTWTDCFHFCFLNLGDGIVFTLDCVWGSGKFH